MHATQAALRTLKDVEGVFGSFLIGETGELFGKDLPAVFHDEVFEETGPRIVRLCEAIEHGGEALDSLVLRFADHKLHVRRSKGGLLCVIANADTNLPALRMALALVARRLGTQEPRTRHSEPPAPEPSKTTRSTMPAAPVSKRPGQTYRGRPVG